MLESPRKAEALPLLSWSAQMCALLKCGDHGPFVYGLQVAQRLKGHAVVNSLLTPASLAACLIKHCAFTEHDQTYARKNRKRERSSETFGAGSRPSCLSSLSPKLLAGTLYTDLHLPPGCIISVHARLWPSSFQHWTPKPCLDQQCTHLHAPDSKHLHASDLPCVVPSYKSAGCASQTIRGTLAVPDKQTWRRMVALMHA